MTQQELRISQQVMEDVNDFIDKTAELEYHWFFGAVLMIMEEGCKLRGVDIEELADLMRDAVYEVNKECGRY